MASEHSYKITLANNVTEKRAIQFLLDVNSEFLLPDKKGRKQVMEALGVDKRYSRAFDLLLLPGRSNTEVEVLLDNPKEAVLVELKTTEKYLSKFPQGFFFGVTQSELDLALNMGDRYRFCFVSLHPDSKKYLLVTLGELEKLTTRKRATFAINF